MDENKYGCATPQFYYLVLLVIVGICGFILGACTAIFVLK